MGVLAVMAVGGCGTGRSERTRAIPPLRASAAPCDPSFLLEESAGTEVRACPAASGAVAAGVLGAVTSQARCHRGGPQRPEGA